MTHTWENPSRSARHPLCALETSIVDVPARVGDRLQRHPVQLGVRRADVPDRAVDDRFDDTTVEQAFHE